MNKKDKYINAVEKAMINNGCAWVEMGKTKDGTIICLVVGWEYGHDKDENLIQKQNGKTIYTLCMKLAYNSDDLQCDYDFDWDMPINEDGDVYDTDQAIDNTGGWRDEFSFWEHEANNLIKLLDDGKLKTE